MGPCRRNKTRIVVVVRYVRSKRTHRCIKIRRRYIATCGRKLIVHYQQNSEILSPLCLFIQLADVSLASSALAATCADVSAL